MADNNTLLAKVLGLKDKYESLQNQLADTMLGVPRRNSLRAEG